MTPDLCELINFVCSHPRSFAHDGKFVTVATFLSGFDWATRNAEGKSELNDYFRDWLARKYYQSHGTPRNYVWWAYLNLHIPEDEDALKQLPLLFQEYLHYKNQQTSNNE